MSRVLRKKKSASDAFLEIMITKPTILLMSIGVGAAFILFG